MKGLFDDLESHLRRNPDDLPDAVIQGFLRVLEEVRVQEMPCSEVFSRLDEYVESEVREHDAAKLMPLLREHLDICPDCCEEYEALLSAIEHTKPADADAPAGPTTIS